MKVTIDDPIIALHPRMADNWIVMADFRFSKYGLDILIPRGFVTDLASIPRWLWFLIAPFELSTTAVIVNDWCYRKGSWKRSFVDMVFLAIMRDENVPRWRRNAAYYGVKVFGGSSFGTNGILIEEVA